MLRSVAHGTHLSLQDETGVFAEYKPPEPPEPPTHDAPEDGGEGKDSGESDLVASLRVEVEELRGELEAQKAKMWKLSCD